MSKYIADRISEGSSHQGLIVAAGAVAVLQGQFLGMQSIVGLQTLN